MLRAGTALADYILPIRTDSVDGADELAEYVRELSTVVRVVVVDGSPRHIHACLDRLLEGTAEHVRPDSRFRCRNGKVAGVLTGLALATHDKVVIADDDVRWDVTALGRVAALLDSYDVVRPQNCFAAPMPWHARWDSARSLVNRALRSADFPGTLGVRREFLADGYDGDVLFENLELIRTVKARGGRESIPLDLYVRRRPPTTAHFRDQRIRQAYDSFAEPGRLAVELSLVPLAVAARRRVALLACLAVAIAEVGRRRAGGRAVFPASTSLWAPAWVAERAVCSWLAVLARLRGGARYGGGASRSRRTRSVRLCEPSQNGLIADRPHRHRATVCRPGSISVPSTSSSRTSPRTISGPSG